MLIFAHIFAGTILGLILTRIIRDPRLIPVCIVGSMIPDLIDKPLGLILFPQSLDNARTFGHTLILVGIIIVIALIVWFNLRTFLIFGLAGAIVLHGLLDEMWNQLNTWIYPLQGFFQPHPEVNFFKSYYLLEITSFSEWVFFFSTLMLFLLAYHENLPSPLKELLQKWKIQLLFGTGILLCILSVYSLICAGIGMENILAYYNNPKNNVILGILALTGCAVLIICIKEPIPLKRE